MDSDIAFALASVLAVAFFLVLLVVGIMVPFMMRTTNHRLRDVLEELQGIKEALRAAAEGAKPN